MRDSIRGPGRALLIFHSPSYRVVGIDNAQEIFVTALHPKSFVSLDRTDHQLLDERDSNYVGEVISAWAGKYVNTPDSWSGDSGSQSAGGRAAGEFLVARSAVR